MSYFPHSEKEINEMLLKLNFDSLEKLVEPIPEKYLAKSINIEQGKTELEVSNLFSEIANKNRLYKSIFLGAGSYNHFIPATLDEIVSRQEFYTSYTPYQAEISQGTLQTIFEYQTYIAILTGMDVSNASLYDGATSLVEASNMAVNITRKNKILVDRFVHPDYIEVLQTYAKPLNIEIVIFESKPFNFDIKKFKEVWNSSFACFIIASPNFCGSIIDFSEVESIIHNDKRLLIQSMTEILSTTVYKSAGKFNVDIVCGEAQSLGIPLNFGGPYLGFIACKKEYLRKLPGRLVGQTKDKDDNIVYVLTLTAREQHIRRELANSNICSNHGLCATRASIYLSLLGKTGLRTCGLKNIENSRYVFEKIKNNKKFKVYNEQIFFNEFIVETDIEYKKIRDTLEKNDILSFYPLGGKYSDLKNNYLITVTENNTKDEIMSSSKVSKNFGDVLNKIKNRKVEKIAIVRNNEMEAIIISLEEYKLLKEILDSLEYKDIYHIIKEREKISENEYISMETVTKSLGINCNDL